jgi:tRNA(fMet)-specific endonuclease VapC
MSARLFLLDTDISIYLLNGRLPAVEQRLATLPGEQVGTTAVTAAELRFGALNSGRPQKNLARVETFLAPLTQIPFDERAAIEYGNLKRHLISTGQLIGIMDLLIAACVLAAGGILVTNNVREFSRVPSLNLENWTE